MKVRSQRITSLSKKTARSFLTHTDDAPMTNRISTRNALRWVRQSYQLSREFFCPISAEYLHLWWGCALKPYLHVCLCPLRHIITPQGTHTHTAWASDTRRSHPPSSLHVWITTCLLTLWVNEWWTQKNLWMPYLTILAVLWCDVI